jgi:protein-tyrosine phosphatase
MGAEIYWIEGIAPHRVATMPMPRSWEGLSDQILALKQEGVETLVSLLTPREVLDLDLKQEPEYCSACGIDFISFPIPDTETPASKTATLELAQRLAIMVKAGKGVAIHCLGGIGRSSLIAACVLAILGIGPEEAFRLIRKSRGCDVPQTAEQKEWVYGFVSTMMAGN